MRPPWTRPHRYDLITTFDAIHDQAKPAIVLSNIYHALRPDGIYLMQDIAGSSHVHNNLDHPMGLFLYTVWCMRSMTVSLAYNGEGSGRDVGQEKALEMLAEAGFTKVEVKQLPTIFRIITTSAPSVSQANTTRSIMPTVS